MIRLDAYRRHREMCTRPDHTDCAGHAAWAVPGIPDESCGVARREDARARLASARALEGTYADPALGDHLDVRDGRAGRSPDRTGVAEHHDPGREEREPPF